MDVMKERRVERSGQRDVAMQCFVSRLSERTRVRAIALVDARGRLLAGAGQPRAMWSMARVASDPKEHVTLGDDVASSACVDVGDEALRLTMLGRGIDLEALGDAARSVARIVASTEA